MVTETETETKTKIIVSPARLAGTPIVVRNTASEWGSAVLFCALCFQAMWTYHDLWRNKPYALATADESLALAGAYAIGVALAIGPLTRMGRLRGGLRLRRPLGVVGGACALAHAFLVVFALREPFDSAGELARFLLGFPTLLLLGLIVGTSWPCALRRLRRDAWRRVQSLAPLLLLLVLAHFTVAGKVTVWISWFRTFGQPDHLPAPGGTFILFLFYTLVLATRCAAALQSRPAGIAALLLACGVALGGGVAWGGLKKAPALEVLCGPALRPAMEELLRAFEKESGIRTEVSYDASNALLGQLRLRPHGDLFIPGDRFYTDEAVKRGLAESPTVIATFAPVILVGKGNPHRVRALADLVKPGLRVGIGEERSTAIGKTTLALFRRNRIALERVPIVYRAAKVDELANAVRLGSIDAAVVWDAVAWGYRGRADSVPIAAKQSIRVPVAAAIVSSSKRKALAGRFLAFVASERGRAVLKSHHYSVPQVADGRSGCEQ